MIEIKAGVDELDPEPGERCTRCKELIIGKKYSVYIQIGDAQTAGYAAHLCERCKLTEDED